MPCLIFFKICSFQYFTHSQIVQLLFSQKHFYGIQWLTFHSTQKSRWHWVTGNAEAPSKWQYPTPVLDCSCFILHQVPIYFMGFFLYPIIYTVSTAQTKHLYSPLSYQELEDGWRSISPLCSVKWCDWWCDLLMSLNFYYFIRLPACSAKYAWWRYGFIEADTPFYRISWERERHFLLTRNHRLCNLHRNRERDTSVFFKVHQP